MRVLIQGGGIGGPALAFWLHKHGHEVVVVESAAGPRDGGYVVDLWGKGYDTICKMGLAEKVFGEKYDVQGINWVDRDGKTSGEFPASVLRDQVNGRMVTVERSAISKALLESLQGKVEVIYNDTIESYSEPCSNREPVQVVLRSGEKLSADILVAADGLRSSLRQKAFGSFEKFEYPLGMRVAAFDSQAYPMWSENCVMTTYNEPGVNMSRFPKRNGSTLHLVAFKNDKNERPPKDLDAIKEELKAAIKDVDWEEKGMYLEELEKADNIYYDSVSQVEMPRWSSGRVVLLGDAASCVSLLAGEGTGLALIEAYVLAGEINRAGGNPEAALANYESRLFSFLKAKQHAARKTAKVFVPGSWWGIYLRNFFLRLLPRFLLVKLALQELKDHIDLPEYENDKPTGKRQESGSSKAASYKANNPQNSFVFKDDCVFD